MVPYVVRAAPAIMLIGFVSQITVVALRLMG